MLLACLLALAPIPQGHSNSIQVLHADRRPAAGVQLQWSALHAGTQSLSVDDQGRTALDGLLVDKDAVPAGGLLAWSESQAAVALVTRVEGRLVSNPRELMLMPAQPLDVRVLHAGQPAAGARVLLLVGAGGIPAVQATADEAGLVRFPAVPLGELRVDASREGGRWRARRPLAEGTWGPSSEPLEIELQATETLEVLVRDPAGRPLEDALVSVAEADHWARFESSSFLPQSPSLSLAGAPFRSAADGIARVSGLLPRVGEQRFPRLRISGSLPGYEVHGSTGPWMGGGQELVARPLADDVSGPSGGPSLKAPPGQPSGPEIARIALRSGEVGIPADGTQVTLYPAPDPGQIEPMQPDPVSVIVRGEALVLHQGLAPVRYWIAATPEGDLARIDLPAEPDGEFPPATFERPRTLELQVLDEAGEPVPDTWVVTHDRPPRVLHHWVQSDAQGRVRLERFLRQKVQVSVAHDGRPTPSAPMVELSLDAEVTQHVLRLPAVLAFTLQFQEGVQARLPGRSWARLGNETCQVVEEDPATGQLRLRVCTPAIGEPRPWRLRLGLDPHADVDLWVQPTDLLQPIPVQLQPACTLRATVQAPPGWSPDLGVERRGPKGEWLRLPVDPQPRSGRRGQLLGDLAPGMYRAIDRRSGLASEGVSLSAGAEALVHLDLTGPLEFSGRLRLPAGLHPGEARIALAARSLDPEHRAPGPNEPDGIRVDATGRFTARLVLGTRYNAWHPWLSGSAAEGLFAGPIRDLELELVEGDYLELVPDDLIDLPERVEVLVGQGSRIAPDPQRRRALRHGEALRLGHLSPGVWTLWLDLGPERAPITLQAVEVGLGVTQLALAPAPAAELEVSLESGGGGRLLGASLRVVGQGHPSYWRSATLDAEGRCTVTGLGLGRFRVELHTLPGEAVRALGHVELDEAGTHAFHRRLR